MNTNPDIIIIGGGLAGLAGAIHLSKKGLQVIVLEKTGYPRHKVCGEYVSNEVLPYLDWLGVNVGKLNPVSINKFEFSSLSGEPVTARLPLGGFGISRYALDHLLYKTAVANGCRVVEGNVTDISFKDDEFTVTASGEKFSAKIAMGAFGKRSNIDQALSRSFIKKKSPWLAVKAHYKGDLPNDVVALHNFRGGYCGVSKVEGNIINICYLADYETFQKYKNIKDYQWEVLCKNRHLKAILDNSEMLFEKPLTISQVSFDKKSPVENHILMTGDTAGLIHPLCGNGMAMAIHSAKIAAELALDFHSGKIKSREELERRYTKEWKRNFGRRMFMGMLLGKALRSSTFTARLMQAAISFPSLLPKIIKQTHGKPIQIAY